MYTSNFSGCPILLIFVSLAREWRQVYSAVIRRLAAN